MFLAEGASGWPQDLEALAKIRVWNTKRSSPYTVGFCTNRDVLCESKTKALAGDLRLLYVKPTKTEGWRLARPWQRDESSIRRTSFEELLSNPWTLSEGLPSYLERTPSVAEKPAAAKASRVDFNLHHTMPS